MDDGLRYLAAVALALLLLGLVALAVADPYEGPLVVSFDAQHSLRALDLLGGLVIAGATALTWMVALTWQRRNITAATHTATWKTLDHGRRGEWSGGRSR